MAELPHLLSFTQAAAQGSFAAAARVLGLTSAAVGKNVAGSKTNSACASSSAPRAA